MFEQAVACPAAVRGWVVSLAFAGGALLVTCDWVISRFWPQLLPKVQTPTTISGGHAETAHTPVLRFVPREQDARAV